MSMNYCDTLGCWFASNQHSLGYKDTPCCEMKSAGISKSAKADTKKEEIPMSYNQTTVAIAPAQNETPKQRSHLLNRVYEIYHARKNVLESKFNILPLDPKTPEEVQEFLKEGYYTIKGLGQEKKSRWFNWPETIEFRKAPADEDGFKTAKDALKAERQKAEDAIIVLPIEDAFTAFKAFEAYAQAA